MYRKDWVRELSACCASVARKVLAAGMRQAFFGVRPYDEDRSMINYVLAQGFDTVYRAEVYTAVPRTYAKLCKPCLRRDRSCIREKIRLLRIVLVRSPLKQSIALFDVVITHLRCPVGYASLVLLVWLPVRESATVIRLLFALFWGVPYLECTVRSPSRMTR